ncbi:PREDICTED: defensin-5-like [Ceratotherium simum simum]|uniref:Defensin-5-like n=1 Tax=Ceratotherium simum simum TaxID=73337 RepID=A0ABM0IAT5_CERSS|nr:PREDICTED: defensin-5-like [Ceratotherium simum simum]
MRTLALLTALLLLALQAQAEPLRERADEVPAQDQPEAEVQDMTISFDGDERSARDASGTRAAGICYCRRTSCSGREVQRGTCTFVPPGTIYLLCCP